MEGADGRAGVEAASVELFCSGCFVERHVEVVMLQRALLQDGASGFAVFEAAREWVGMLDGRNDCLWFM
jgi:hypothetical protein